MAHRSALEAAVPTVAVLGTGVRRVFPMENASLAREMVSRGTLVSQFPDHARPSPGCFLQRNKVIAGMSEASIGVCAGERSGTRQELECSIRYGRPVLLWSPAFAASRWAAEAVSRGEAWMFSDKVQLARLISAL